MGDRLTRHTAAHARGDPLPQWWAPLHRSIAQASVFVSAHWIGTWLEVYGAEFDCRWIWWEEGGAVVAGCLLPQRTVLRRLIPLRSVYFNATGESRGRTPLAEFNDILCLPGRESAVARDFSELLASMRWSRVLLSGYADGGALDCLSAMLPSARVDRRSEPAPYVDIAALKGESFEASLSANTRGQIRRSRNLYQEKHGELRLDVASTPDEAQSFLDALARLHGERWKAKGEAGSFASPNVADFHRRLVAKLKPGEEVDLIRVCAGTEDIGYLYNINDQGKVCFFQSGFAYQDDSRLKPGLLTHAIAVEHYRRRGFREYDFLAGEARYKRSLANAHRTLHWTTLYRDRLWLRALLRLRTLGDAFVRDKELA